MLQSSCQCNNTKLMCPLPKQCTSLLAELYAIKMAFTYSQLFEVQIYYSHRLFFRQYMLFKTFIRKSNTPLHKKYLKSFYRHFTESFFVGYPRTVLFKETEPLLFMMNLLLRFLLFKTFLYLLQI